MKRKTNRDFSRYFSVNRMNRVPLYKLLISGLLAVTLTAGLGTGIAVWAFSGAGQETSVQAELSPTPTPAPTATPTPTPQLRQVKMEIATVQQSIGVDLVEEVDGEEFPLTGEPFVVLITDEDENTQSYDIDPDTGTLLVEKVEPGDYRVELEEKEGYALPEPQTVTVKEKVVYVADTAAVADKIVQSNQVVESQEDNIYGQVADAVVTPPSDTVEYVDSSSESVSEEIQVYTGAKLNDEGYMLLKDGTVTDYKPVFDTATGYLVKAVRSALPSPTPVPVPSVILTPTPAPEPTESPEAAQTPEPSQGAASGATSQALSQTPSPTGAALWAQQLSGWFADRLGRLGAGLPLRASSVDFASWPDEILLYDMDKHTMASNEEYPFDLSVDTVSTETGEVLYSGWNTMDGKKYYFDPETHAPVTGTQVIGGVTYHFDSNGVLKQETRGVDVSKYQGNIDWNQVKAAGYEFAIIRVGYRGYGSGALVEDSHFRQNIQGATAAGLQVGLYFYSQAINEEEAVEEASMVLRLCSGYRLDYPIYFDTEKVAGDTGRADSLSRAERTACAVAFCETIRNAGYTAGVYSYASWFYNQLNMSNFGNYQIWIAQYRDVLDFSGRYNMWQYASDGCVPGISKLCDLNIAY
ncbi:MAG: hypothetical protein MR579_03610 [Bacteroidales bacterium]|nr:hypothetical protein [Bacteroidales bacterium]